MSHQLNLFFIIFDLIMATYHFLILEFNCFLITDWFITAFPLYFTLFMWSLSLLWRQESATRGHYLRGPAGSLGGSSQSLSSQHPIQRCLNMSDTKYKHMLMGKLGFLKTQLEPFINRNNSTELILRVFSDHLLCVQKTGPNVESAASTLRESCSRCFPSCSISFL